MAAVTPYLFGKGGNLEFCSKHEQMACKITINSEIREQRIKFGQWAFARRTPNSEPLSKT